MKRRIPFYLIITLLLVTTFLSQCDNEEMMLRKYSSITIADNIWQNEDGVTFEGEVTSKGELKVIERGFVWAANSEPTLSSPRITEKELNNDSKFKLTATFDYCKGNRYKVRAFLRDSLYTVYGKVVEFESAYNSPDPIISLFSAPNGSWGDTVTIKGKNFSYFIDNIKVHFGDADALIYASNDSTILVKVPDNENNDSVNLAVNVYDNIAVSKTKFKYLKPEIEDFLPKSGTFNDTITILGSNFPLYSNNCQAKFDGISAQVLEYSKTEIKLLIPLKISNPVSELDVTVSGVNKVFSSKFHLNTPVLSDFSPVKTNMAKSVITIFGQNFNPDATLDNVRIGNHNAQVISASKNQLEIKVPYDLDEGNHLISVTAGGMTCTSNNEVSFTSPWTKKADFPGSGRWLAIGLSIKDKGYIGLGNSENLYYSSYLIDFWEYDAGTENWIRKTDFNAPRNNPVYFSLNNYGYIGAGYRWITILGDFWQYIPDTGEWIQKAGKSSDMVSPVCFSVAGCGYYCDDRNRYLWKYDPLSNSWLNIGNLPVSRSYSTGFAIGNKLYYCTGYYSNAFYTDLWEYDIPGNKWTSKAKLPGIARYGAIGFALNGKGYLGLGQANFEGTFLKDFWEYDPVANIWTRIPDFPGVARSSAVSFVINNKAYAGTGLNEMKQVTNDFWVFDPARE